MDNAISEDGGVYTCVAKNTGGEVLCKAELIVHEGNVILSAAEVASIATALCHTHLLARTSALCSCVALVRYQSAGPSRRANDPITYIYRYIHK